MKSVSVFALTLLTVFTLIGCQSLVKETDRVGYLVIAHGSRHGHHVSHVNSPWNQIVMNTVNEAKAQLDGPVEVAFGMWNAKAFERGITDLHKKGVSHVKVVPLFVSSHSSVIRAQRYQFHLAAKAPKGLSRLKRVSIPENMEVSYGKALDDSPFLSRILIKRALELSTAPDSEVLFLVAHGPVSDKDNQIWLKNLNIHGQRIQNDFGSHSKRFADVKVVSLRDDADKAVRGQATENLRNMIQKVHRERKRPLILPVLIAQGGIESGLLQRLQGLDYVYQGKMIAPDSELSAWIAQSGL